jgi:hypothetical protein
LRKIWGAFKIGIRITTKQNRGPCESEKKYWIAWKNEREKDTTKREQEEKVDLVKTMKEKTTELGTREHRRRGEEKLDSRRESEKKVK